MELGMWDIILIVGVSTQATVMAYTFEPKWKALLYSLPIPFTLASMSLGEPIGVTHVAGLLVLLGFFHLVRLLHQVRKWPILVSIVLGAACYATAGAGLAEIFPRGPLSFWVAVLVTGIVGMTLFLATPHRPEPGHRSPLPVWIKLPTIMIVIGCLVAVKQHLRGFMPMFPMMGVITAYEGRHSLWTITFQLPFLFLPFLTMMTFYRVLQPHIWLVPAFAMWLPVHLATLSLITRWQWARRHRQEQVGE